MNPEYNIDLAKTRLEVRSNEYALNGDDNAKLLSAIDVSQYKVTEVNEPRTWRLTKKGDEDNRSDVEEEMFHVYGVICMCDLPPIKAKDTTHLKKKAIYIRQAVRLTGFDTGAFKGTVDQVERIHDMFRGDVNCTMSTGWEPAIYEGYKALDFNARYFTQRRNAPHERGQPFAKGVDPDNLLASIRGQELIHGNDNRVDYLSEKKDSNGNTKLTRIEPSKFKIGDIVRATISFVTFPTKNNTAVMTMVLKALTYIESINHKKDEDIEQKTIHKATTIKRKVLFEEEIEAREGMAAMNLNDTMKESDD